MKKVVLLFLAGLSLAACGSSRRALLSNRFGKMTTTELAAGYDTVFSATLFILREQAFSITSADRKDGLIVADKRIAPKYNSLTDTLPERDVKAGTLRATFRLRALNPGRTGVKLTVYAGDGTVMKGEPGQPYSGKNNSIVRHPRIYQTWLDRLRHEVDVRKGIIAVEPPEILRPADGIQP